MLFAVSGLVGCSVKASDGDIGAVKDFLFDDHMEDPLDGGRRRPLAAGRQVLIHPSAIAPLQLPPKPSLPMMS